MRGRRVVGAHIAHPTDEVGGTRPRKAAPTVIDEDPKLARSPLEDEKQKPQPEPELPARSIHEARANARDVIRERARHEAAGVVGELTRITDLVTVLKTLVPENKSTDVKEALARLQLLTVITGQATELEHAISQATDDSEIQEIMRTREPGRFTAPPPRLTIEELRQKVELRVLKEAEVAADTYLRGRQTASLAQGILAIYAHLDIRVPIEVADDLTVLAHFNDAVAAKIRAVRKSMTAEQVEAVHFQTQDLMPVRQPPGEADEL